MLKSNVLVVFGGKSVEHDISILSFIQAINAINSDKYRVLPLYLSKDGDFFTSKNLHDINTFKKDFTKQEVLLYKHKNCVYLKKKLSIKKTKIDVCLLIVHGKFLEDGSLAGYFEVLGIPYTTPNVLNGAIFQNKYVTKVLLEKEKIKVVKGFTIWEDDFKNEKIKEKILKKVKTKKFPLIIKAISLGSSIGIKKVDSFSEFESLLDEVFKYENRVIVEECMINYREFNQAFYFKKDNIILSEIEEVKTVNQFLTFKDKYQEGFSNHICPALITKELKDKISLITKRIARIFKPKGVIRVDYLMDEKNNLYVNEINSIPGSLAFYLFEEIGIDFKDLLDDLIMDAISTKYKEDQKTNSFSSSVLFNSKGKK